MVDATLRPLKIPSRFVPYLEKHHIYDLLHELTIELVMKKPDDHILFLKQALGYANKTKDCPKVIILAPPHFDKMYLAELLSEHTGIEVVCRVDVFHEESQKSGNELVEDADTLAKCAVKVLKTEPIRSCGWVLADFPKDYHEAVTLQRAGVLPTHVFQLLPTSIREATCFQPPGCVPCCKTTDACRIYRQELRGLREAYQHVLKECEIRGRSMEELARDCADVIQIMKHHGAPMLPRVVIIGSRGSGRNTQALLLHQRFNIVHVDLKKELKRLCVSKGSLSDYARSLEANGIPISHEIKVSVVENRILEKDSLSKGWVLTGFPSNIYEMKSLYLMDTPPNRIILLDVPLTECRKRLVFRRVNMYTGSQHHLQSNPPMDKRRLQVGIHPDDYYSKVTKEIEDFQREIPKIIEYCGKHATKVSGCHSINTIHESICAAIIRPPPPAQPKMSIWALPPPYTEPVAAPANEE